MKKEAINIVKKTAKLAGVVCVAAGAVALMTSKTALQVILEGRKYFKNTVKKILHEEPQVEEITENAAAAVQKEVVAEAEDFAEADPQEAAEETL